MVPRGIATALIVAGLSIAGPAALASAQQPSDAFAISSTRAGGGEEAGSCRETLPPRVPSLRYRRVLMALDLAGVRAAGITELSHGRPYRLLDGPFEGQHLYATAIRPGTDLHLSGTRLLRSFPSGSTTVSVRVTCERPHVRSFTFVAHGVDWAFTGLRTDSVKALVEELAW